MQVERIVTYTVFQQLTPRELNETDRNGNPLFASVLSRVGIFTTPASVKLSARDQMLQARIRFPAVEFPIVQPPML